MAASPLATVGILSIGDMGAGVARLLTAHRLRCVSNVNGRSQFTVDRARSANVELFDSDEEVVAQSDYILSIVPPRDAVATAERIVKVLDSQSRQDDDRTLYFLDLNAIAPSTSRSIGNLFAKHAEHVRYVDGGIIGRPPRLDQASAAWINPSIVLSGPHPLSSAPVEGPLLLQTLNGKEVGSDIGSASGLKCCFASLAKGFTALAIQTFSTASQLGVLPHLQEHLVEFNPRAKDAAERGLVDMAPKAYRWVDEMHEIAKALREDGGWVDGRGNGIFDSIADVYDFVANGTALGEEHVDDRKRTSAIDIISALTDGLRDTKEH